MQLIESIKKHWIVKAVASLVLALGALASAWLFFTSETPWKSLSGWGWRVGFGIFSTAILVFFIWTVVLLRRAQFGAPRLVEAPARLCELEERMLYLFLNSTSLITDEIRIYFDGIHDQRLVHHRETLEFLGLLARVPPPEKGRDFPRWQISSAGRAYLAKWDLIPIGQEMRSPEQVTRLQWRMLNFLSIAPADTVGISSGAIVVPLEVAEQNAGELFAMGLIEDIGMGPRSQPTWSLTAKGRAYIFHVESVHILNHG